MSVSKKVALEMVRGFLVGTVGRGQLIILNLDGERIVAFERGSGEIRVYSLAEIGTDEQLALASGEVGELIAIGAIEDIIEADMIVEKLYEIPRDEGGFRIKIEMNGR